MEIPPFLLELPIHMRIVGLQSMTYPAGKERGGEEIDFSHSPALHEIPQESTELPSHGHPALPAHHHPQRMMKCHSFTASSALLIIISSPSPVFAPCHRFISEIPICTPS
jgi:hypothetical protein